MAWFKADDKLPSHRKARAVRKSHPDKRRDVAPFGIWVLAGCWSDDGFVPLEVLEEWDDEAAELARRLVRAGMWHRTERDGEPGYVFHDWDDQNPGASHSGAFGNHVRWHEMRGKTDPECEHCESGRIAPESGATDSRIGSPSLPSRPVPNRPDPKQPSRKRSETDLDRFDQFWDTYANKVGRKKAETAYAAALKKPHITADLLIEAAATYIAWQIAEGKHPQFTKHPATWLNGEHWTDELRGRAAPMTRVGQHMALVRQLAAEEAAPRQIGPSA
jgi:hypothetical protein